MVPPLEAGDRIFAVVGGELNVIPPRHLERLPLRFQVDPLNDRIFRFGKTLRPSRQSKSRLGLWLPAIRACSTFKVGERKPVEVKTVLGRLSWRNQNNRLLKLCRV